MTAPHIETPACGFDRNASLSQDCYVCLCGWPNSNAAPQRPTPRTDAVAIGIATRASCSAITELARSLERSLSERAEECERLRGLLREAAKLLWSHNGAGQEKAWALSEKIDAFSTAEAGGDTSTRSKT